jgi:hypothetical protein
VYEYVIEYVKQSSSFNRDISIRPMALEIEHAHELVRRLHGGRRREVRERLQARALIAHAETAAHCVAKSPSPCGFGVRGWGRVGAEKFKYIRRHTTPRPPRPVGPQPGEAVIRSACKVGISLDHSFRVQSLQSVKLT